MKDFFPFSGSCSVRRERLLFASAWVRSVGQLCFLCLARGCNSRYPHLSDDQHVRRGRATSKSPVSRSAVLQKRKERFDPLYRKYSRYVLGYALNRGLTLEEAQDVVAETFLVCWRRLDEVPSDALPWVMATARKLMANHWRSNRRRNATKERMTEALSHTSQNAASVDHSIHVPELETALNLLSAKEREAILLVTWDGLSHAEAAKIAECSRATFAVRAHRARSHLVEYLDGFRTNVPSEVEAFEAETS